MNKTYQLLSLTFYVLTLLFLSMPISAKPTWVINPSKIPDFDRTEQHRLEAALAPYDIKVRYDNTLNVPPVSSLPVRSQALLPLLQGKHVQVSLITPAQEALHIGVSVKNMATLHGEALTEFGQMIRHIIQTFHDLGYGDYLAFCDFGKTYSLPNGQKMQGHCWEMIPLGKGHTLSKNGNYFLAPKIWRNSYLLFNTTPYFQDIDPTLAKKFKKILHLRLTRTLSHSSAFAKNTLPWDIHIPDFKQTKEATLDRLLKELESLGAVQIIPSQETSHLMKPSKNATGEEFSSSKLHSRKTCAFCKEKVLRTQEMIRGKHVTIVYNYMPYVKDKHFMVIPFVHQESFYALPSEHFEEIIRWSQKLTFALNNPKNVIWFCQNGPFAGQTTPHAHLHVLERPAPVPLLSKILNNLSGRNEPPLTEANYQAVRAKLLEALKAVEDQKHVPREKGS